MISRSTFLHLRIPFSFFLLPVYLFALSISNNHQSVNVLLVFIIVHFFIYPASNGYNSYFDKDEESIGALKNPPEVTKQLYYTSLSLDVIGIILAFLVNWQFALLIFVYGLVSKAYSHPAIRLKKRPITSWITAGFFQGFFTFMTCFIGINDTGFDPFLENKVVLPAFLSSLLLWGSYPMTQIYQHEEDRKRGDITLSSKLGINGTFHFTAIFFTISVFSFFYYFFETSGLYFAVFFVIFLIPTLFFFIFWYFRTKLHPGQANFYNTMILNVLSSTGFNIFFLWIYFLEL